MIHVILAETYAQAARYAKDELKLTKVEFISHCAVIYDDEHYMRLSSLARDPAVVKVHTVGDPFLPKCWEVLRMKGLIK